MAKFGTGARVASVLAMAVVLLALASSASAVVTPLTLTGVAGDFLGPQSTSNPCIIAATQCQQPAGFGFNNFTASGNISSYNMFSTTPTANVADGVQGIPYTVGQITGAVGSSTFVVAIDVNTTNGVKEVLDLFEVIINGAVAYNYVGPTNISPVSNNGNGFGDFQLSLIDLSSYAASATVLFHAVWHGAVDGGESFFLVSAPGGHPPVAQPATLLLLGPALVGVALWGRKWLGRGSRA